VFPYLYIPYDGSAPPDKMGHQIFMALDRAVNILQGQGYSSHHVFKTVLLVVFKFMDTMQKKINYSNSIFIIPTQENIQMTFC
jgi:hypothetical protein